jgi:hypothetical protein
MRAVLSSLLAVHLLLAAAAPHVHLPSEGAASEPCATCVTRTADVAATRTPDVAPAPVPAGAAVPAPGLAPVTGAPLGAVPGQSPPGASR